MWKNRIHLKQRLLYISTATTRWSRIYIPPILSLPDEQRVKGEWATLHRRCHHKEDHQTPGAPEARTKKKEGNKWGEGGKVLNSLGKGGGTAYIYIAICILITSALLSVSLQLRIQLRQESYIPPWSWGAQPQEQEQEQSLHPHITFRHALRARKTELRWHLFWSSQHIANIYNIYSAFSCNFHFNFLFYYY